MSTARTAPLHPKQQRAHLHRLHQIAGRLAKQAGFNAEPYLTFPLRAPGVLDAAEAEIAAAAAPASTTVTAKPTPADRMVYGDPNSQVTKLEIDAEVDPEGTIALIDALLAVAPHHVTHCMSAWNRARRLKHYLETGDEVDQALSWDQHTGMWVF